MSAATEANLLYLNKLDQDIENKDLDSFILKLRDFLEDNERFGCNFLATNYLTFVSRKNSDFFKNFYFRLDDLLDQTSPIYYYLKAISIDIGNGIERNFENMKFFLEKAVKLNHSRSMVFLGHFYPMTNQHYHIQFDLFQKAVNLNNSTGMHNLALLIQDDEQKIQLLEKSASFDNPLSLMYLYRLKKDDTYLLKAAELHFPDAFAKLSSNYYSQKLFVMSFEYLKKSFFYGLVESSFDIYIFLTHGIGCERNFIENIKYLKIAVEEEMIEALYEFGFILFNGIFIERDEKDAYYLFKIASNESYLARFWYAICLIEGRGCDCKFLDGFEILTTLFRLFSDFPVLSIYLSSCETKKRCFL